MAKLTFKDLENPKSGNSFVENRQVSKLKRLLTISIILNLGLTTVILIHFLR